MSTLVLPAGSVGNFINLDVMTQAVIGWLANYENPRTRTAYKHDLKVFLAWCEREHVTPLDAKRPHLALYLRWLQTQGYAEATVGRRFGSVAMFYKAAVIDDLITKDPTLGIIRPKVDLKKQYRPFLNPIDFARFVQEAERAEPMTKAMLLILALRGLRIAELCSLDVDSFQQQQGRWVLRYVAKGGELMVMPLPGQVVMAVQAIIGDRTTGPLILNKRDRRMDRGTASRRIKEIAAAAGVSTKLSPHSMRRSLITTGYAMGIPGHELQQTVGHKSQATTARYDGLAGNMNRDKTQEISGFLALAGAA